MPRSRDDAHVRVYCSDGFLHVDCTHCKESLPVLRLGDFDRAREFCANHRHEQGDAAAAA